MHPKAILFLEPANANLYIIRQAKEQGYRVIVFTMSPDAVKKTRMPYGNHISAIDEIIEIESWGDTAGIVNAALKLQERVELAGVYTSIDTCLVCWSAIREALGLPTNSQEMLGITGDKYKLRKMLLEKGLTTLRIVDGPDFDMESEWPFAGAAYFKPCAGSGSVCVQRCNNWLEVADAKAKYDENLRQQTDKKSWLSNYVGPEGAYYLEEEVIGELLSVEALVGADQVHILGVLGRNLYTKNPIISLGSLFPYRPVYHDAIVEKAKAILKAVGYKYGAAHIEMIVTSTGEIELIDLNCRFAGADVTLTINEAYDTAIEKYLVEIALGGPLEEVNLSPQKCCVIQSFFLPSEAEILNSIEFPAHPNIFGTQCRLAIGSPISAEREEHNASGCVMVFGETMDEAVKLTKQISENILVNGEFSIEV